MPCKSSTLTTDTYTLRKEKPRVVQVDKYTGCDVGLAPTARLPFYSTGGKMHVQATKIERRYLLATTLGNLTVGSVGLAFSVVATSQAILLDGLFNLAYCVTSLFTIKVAQLVERGDDEHFPFGYSYFESLANGIKGMLVLGITVMAMVGAVESLFTGGRTIAAGVAVAYGIFAAAVCWGLALATRVGARTSGSPLVRADAENWIVNAAVSSAVLLAFGGILVLQRTAFAFLAPYVDPALVLLIVLVSISVPIRMAWSALMELLNRAPSPEIVAQANKIVKAATADLPVRHQFLRIIQPGRTRLVLVHLVLPSGFRVETLPSLDAVREKTLAPLRDVYSVTYLDMIFTADTKWGAPTRLEESGSIS